MIPIARPIMDEREADAARRVILSGWITQGPEVAAFEGEFAGFLGAPGIGYTYDAQASHRLEAVAPDTYSRVASTDPKHFLFLPEIHGLDGSKADVANIPRCGLSVPFGG